MRCVMCQTKIRRHSLDDYFRKMRVCDRCQTLNTVSFESSEVPYHHVMLDIHFSGVFKDPYLYSRIFAELIQYSGDFLTFSHEPNLDAIVLSLMMSAPLYVLSYLTLDNVEYIQSLEVVPVLLIHG